ncbi:MAG: ATP-binding protein, partial [Anaerolineae bacterium]|nr:ATP-binding protein [Anaerolineae bacterium]
MARTNTTSHENESLGRPKPLGNLFIGSWRLLFWLFFHPSAWQDALSQVDPTLSSDFCLAALHRFQLKQIKFWRLLLMMYLAWPVMGVLLIIFGLWLLNAASTNIILGVIVGLAVALVLSVATAVSGSMVVSTAVGLAASIVVGIAAGLIVGEQIPFLATTITLSFDLVLSTVIGLAGGLGGGLAYGMTLGLAGDDATFRPSYSLIRQITGIIIGVLVGVAGGVMMGVVTGSWLAGVVLGLPFALAISWRTHSWRRGAAWGIFLGIIVMLVWLISVLSLADTLFGSFINGISLGAIIAALFALPYVAAERIAGPWAGALAGTLGSSSGLYLLVTADQPIGPVLLFTFAGILLGLTLGWWRPVIFYPFTSAWNLLLQRLDERRLAQGQPSRVRWHSVFWDELQRLPLIGLDNYIVLLLENDVELGTAVMDSISSGRQRWAAQAAQIEMDARQFERCQDITAIGTVHNQMAAGELAGPASALLRSFSRVSQDVDAAQRQESAYNQRLAFHAVEDRLDGLLRELTRSNERYAERFRPIAASWRQTIADHTHHLADEAELRQEIDSPYIIGVPLTEQQEIFIGRAGISAQIEQLLLDRRRPPLLLYGQRRVGKTSLLNNLGRLLPSTIIPLFVDLQGPASRSKNEASFLYNLARGMRRSARQREISVPELTRETLAVDPFSQFDEWLDEVEEALAPNFALLMLDEFEVLAEALENGRLEESSILGMFRHLIQHRPRFKVLLSGSHTLDEFQRWSSYLINVQVVHIGYLSQTETLQLVEHPVQDFSLRYEPAAAQRVVDLTNGHPFLVQLLCAEIVALKNEQPPVNRRLASVADVETAVPEALQHGSFFFADIEQNQVDQVGREILRLM